MEEIFTVSGRMRRRLPVYKLEGYNGEAIEGTILRRWTAGGELFADTDRLCYDIKTKDVFDGMAQDTHLFDTSNYPLTYPLS